MLAARALDSGGVYPGPQMNPGGPMASPTATPTPTATAPTPGPAPTPPPTVQTSAGYTPDYGNILNSDPTMAAANNNAIAAKANADAARKQALRSAYVRFGGVLPAGFSDQFGDIDQATKDAAAANSNSTWAQLQANYQKGVDQFKRALAARHMLSSGELGYGQDQLDRGLSQQEYDAGNQFTDQANQAYGAYAGVLGQNARDLQGALQGAMSNVLQNDAYKPVAPTYADYDAASSAQYGTPVYKGSDGQLYDANGSLFTPPSASPAAAGAGGHSDAWYRFHDPTYGF